MAQVMQTTESRPLVQTGVLITPVAVAICPKCMRRQMFKSPSAALALWSHCGSYWHCDPLIECPNSICGTRFRYEGQTKCPSCGNGFDNGVPLPTFPPDARLLDRLIPGRRDALFLQTQRVKSEFKAVRKSWADSLRSNEPFGNSGTQFEQDHRAVLDRHLSILIQFKEDLEKFLHKAPVRLARHEGEYSWKFREELDKEVVDLLEGILAGRSVATCSLGFLARCSDAFPSVYSREFMKAEVARRFYERRLGPKPGFLLTLDFARSLSGEGFEQWLEQLLRDAGIPSVTLTQASHDQGADLIVEASNHKIVIQAKQYRQSVGNEAVQQALGARDFYGAFQAWVVTTSSFTKDAIDLAFRAGVVLIDGSRLLNLADLIQRWCSEVQGANSNALEISPAVAVESHPRDVAEASSVGSELSMVAAVDPVTSGPPHQPALAVPNRTGRRRVLLIAASLIAVSIGASAIRNQSSTRRETEHQIRVLLDTYQNAIRTRNAQRVADCYAPVVERFYLSRAVPQKDVRSQFNRNFATYTSVANFALTDLAFRNVDEASATVEFEREWDFRGPRHFAGREREQMTFIKTNDHWQIRSETEVKVYWVRR